MGEAATTENVRPSRFWLYAPFALLLLIAVAWSIGWFLIRNRTAQSIDTWFGLEAKAGRQWTCQNRSIGGFPFRIEVACSMLKLQHGAVNASFGPVEAVAQIYQPRFVITEIDGPVSVTDGQVSLEGHWDLLQTSVHSTQSGLQRLSVVAKAPAVTVTGLTPEPIAVSGQEMEFHVRPSPSLAQEKAYDVALSVDKARAPVLDTLVGGTDPADLKAELTVSQADGFRGRPVAEELERWRAAGGTLDIRSLTVSKGSRQLEAKGAIAIDEQHRLAGKLSIAAAGLDGLLGNMVGNRTGAALLGALLGQGRPEGGEVGGKPALLPLPPLRFANGVLALGPFVIPKFRLPAIY